MKHSMTRMMTAACALSVAGCSPDVGSYSSTYAESVYENYEEAAEGKVHFDLTMLDEGVLSAIAYRPLADVLGGIPAEWIVFQAEGTKLAEVGRGLRNPAIDEWVNPPVLTDYESMGYPVADGEYRLFEVNATIDGTMTQHRALEVCWGSVGHCVVIDPAVTQLDGYYKNRQRWLAEGWGPTIEDDGPLEELPDGVTALTRSCKLSRFSTTSKRYYWPAQYAAGYNVLGWKLYENRIGAQEVKLRCYINSNGACKAAASAISNGSSCSTFFPFWSCDCDNVDYFAYTGSTAKTEAKTKCVDNFGGATVDASISGAGASFSVSWTISGGSLYTNGNSYTDTCIWQ